MGDFVWISSFVIENLHTRLTWYLYIQFDNPLGQPYHHCSPIFWSWFPIKDACFFNEFFKMRDYDNDI